MAWQVHLKINESTPTRTLCQPILRSVGRFQLGVVCSYFLVLNLSRSLTLSTSLPPLSLFLSLSLSLSVCLSVYISLSLVPGGLDQRFPEVCGWWSHELNKTETVSSLTTYSCAGTINPQTCSTTGLQLNKRVCLCSWTKSHTTLVRLNWTEVEQAVVWLSR